MGTHPVWRRLCVALGLLLALISAAGLGLYTWLLADLPSLDQPTASAGDSLYHYAAAPSSKIYDRHGRLLFEMPPPYTGRHSPVPLEEIPLALRQALVATEDASFYQNPGVDAWAIVRAVWINVRGGEVLSGGSTLTQQLARNLLLSPEERYERTLTRKLREAVLAWRMARHYSKDEILGLYLNEIYFGNMAYGAEAAAQAYFGKHIRDLDLAECALLAGLPQAPSYYNPLENLEAATERQGVVLDLMIKQGYISREEADLARREKLYFASAPFDIQAPHFVMYVRGLLEQELGLERLERGGLEVYTTLDLDLNETARDVIRHRLASLAECRGVNGPTSQPANCPPGGHNVRNAALVALDPQTGEILAMVGSPDYFSARIDGAVNGATALRQPGSSIKPLTYAAAFAQGDLTAATMMLDVRRSFVTKEGASYVPLNYDLQFRGPVRLREALASSYNLIAVKVLDSIGVEAMTSLARRLGISTFDDPDRLGLALTLGGGEVRLLEQAAAFGALANGGQPLRPLAILRVEDAEGRVVLSSPPQSEEQVLDPRVAYLVTHVLSDNVARIPGFGEGSVLELSRPAAVKTGTTTDFRDNWTVGYTPDLVTGVWAGNADNEPMRDVSGVTGAAPIWHDFMEAALRGLPVREFDRPPGLVEAEVCSLSGLLAGPDCPHRVQELFITGTEPTETCDLHQRIAIDGATGQRATADTPPERLVEKVYTILPPEGVEWAREHGLAQPPATLAAAENGSVLQGEGGQPQEVALAAEDRGEPLIMAGPDAGAVYHLDPALPRGSQRILVAARVGTEVTLPQVTLLVDGQRLVKLHAPPYEAWWPLVPGIHEFWAEATGAGGERLESQRVQIEVQE
jgi:1A family penicillin-binding protein